MSFEDTQALAAPINEFLRLYTRKIEERYRITIHKREQNAYIREASRESGFEELDITLSGTEDEDEGSDEGGPSQNLAQSPSARQRRREDVVDLSGEASDAHSEVSDALASDLIEGDPRQPVAGDVFDVKYEQRMQAELEAAQIRMAELETDHDNTLTARTEIVNEAQEQVDAMKNELNALKKNLRDANAARELAERDKRKAVNAAHLQVVDAQARMQTINALKRQRNTANQAVRRQRFRSEVGYLNLEAVGERDKKWAVEQLLAFARIAPHDAMAMLRNVCRTLSAKAKLWVEPEAAVVPDELSALDAAISLANATANKKDIQHSLRCFHLMVTFREAARRHRIGELSGEESAKNLVRRRKAFSFYSLGIRVWPIAWCISPRNMFGLLLMPLLGLHGAEIMSIKASKLQALCSLFITSASPGSAARLGLPLQYAAAIDFIVERLIPSMELALIKNLAIPNLQLPTELGKLIALRRHEQTGDQDVDVYGFGLRMSKDSASQRTQTEVFMPEAFLIDGSYKTRTPGSTSVLFANVLDGKLRVDVARHMVLENKHPIDRRAADSFASYSQFWRLPLSPTPSVPDVYPGCTPRPPVDSIPDHLWDVIDPRVAFWGSFTNLQAEQCDPAFFGHLTERSLNIEKAQDSTLGARRKDVDSEPWDVETDNNVGGLDDGVIDESEGDAGSL